MKNVSLFCYGGWIVHAFWLFAALLPGRGQAQTLDSRLGAAHTPRGHLHILVVFVNYGPNNPQAPGWSSWPNDSTLPTFVQDTIPGMNQLFTADTTTLKNNLSYQNISQYYYRMSDGKFLLTGDVYEQQVRPSWYHRAPRGQGCRTAFGDMESLNPHKETAA